MKYFLVLIIGLVCVGAWLSQQNNQTIEEYTSNELSSVKIGRKPAQKNKLPEDASDSKIEDQNSIKPTIEYSSVTHNENYTPPENGREPASLEENDPIQEDESLVVTMDIGPSEMYSNEGVQADED